MTYSAYEIRLDQGEDFDREFRSFIARSHKRAARLLSRLEAFPGDPEGCGEFLRGSGKRELHAVPKRGTMEDEAGLVALVDHGARTIKPVRFLLPEEARDWDGVVRWAEEYLGI